jgi:hypothetical protein
MRRDQNPYHYEICAKAADEHLELLQQLLARERGATL